MVSELREEMAAVGAPRFTHHDVVVGDEALVGEVWWEVVHMNQNSLGPSIAVAGSRRSVD